jgi:hypothetical protein
MLSTVTKEIKGTLTKFSKKKKNVFDKKYEQARHKTFFHPKLILFSFKAFQKQNYSNLNSALIC